LVEASSNGGRKIQLSQLFALLAEGPRERGRGEIPRLEHKEARKDAIGILSSKEHGWVLSWSFICCTEIQA